MFTGIIREIGRVGKIVKNGSLTELSVRSKIISGEAGISDSIAVNGVCLTLTHKIKEELIFDAISSTLQISNLKRLKISDYVNLEPALTVGDKLGGHFVLGHVDKELKLRRIAKQREIYHLEIDLPNSFRKNIVEQGSIAVEGISLTIKKIYPAYWTLDIIPFTYEHTNLKYKKAGGWLNVEFDYLLKSGQRCSG